MFLWVPKTSNAFPVTQEKHMGKDKISNYDDCGTRVESPSRAFASQAPTELPRKAPFHGNQTFIYRLREKGIFLCFIRFLQ